MLQRTHASQDVMTPLAVLLVQVADADASAWLTALRAGSIQVIHERVADAGALQAALAARTWDVVLADLDTPVVDGLQPLWPLHLAKVRHPGLPVVFITRHTDLRAAVAALKAGADDCLLATDLPQLAASVRAAVDRHAFALAARQPSTQPSEWKAVFDRAPVAQLLQLPFSTIKRINHKFVEQFGYSLAEVVGRHPAEIGMRVEDALLAPLVEALRAGAEVDRMDLHLRHKDGTQRLVLASSSQVWLDGTLHYLHSFVDVTVQRSAEQQARLSQMALASVSQGVLISGPDRLTLSVNRAFEAMTGYGEQELVGRSCAILQGPQTDPHAVALLRQALDAGQSHHCELRNYRKDGSKFWNELTVNPVFDSGGQLTHFVGIQRDITARVQDHRRLEQALAGASEGARTLDALLEHVPVGITIADAPDVRIRMVSRHGLELAGKPRGVLEGIPADRHSQAWTLFEADGTTPARNESLPLTRATLQGEQVRDEIWVLGDASGRRVPILCSAGPIRDASGHITGGIIAWRDDSERQAGQAQLKLAAQVFAQGREGVTVTDAHGCIVMVNQAFTEITGFSEAEILGRNPSALSSGRQGEAFYTDMWGAINTHGSWCGEIWNRRKDGTEYPEWLTISAVRDGQGAVTNYVGTFSDISEQVAARERIDWLSHFDPLTALPNRALLADRCAQHISTAHREGKPLAMMVLGIDKFRLINDTRGHAVGDQLLVAFAQRIGNNLREPDTVARVAGDEFVLVLPGGTVEGASLLALRLLHALQLPYTIDGAEFDITASIGVAIYPQDGLGFEDLFTAATVALHQAKGLGQAKHQFYNAAMFQSTVAQVALASALRGAVAQGQFRLHYQPFADLQTGIVGGMEALLRWTHPVLGEISPSRFIPVAESTGLILEIGAWVLRQACSDLRDWRARGVPAPTISVNLSPVQFRDEALVAHVRATLHEFDIPPNLISIELTEGALMEDVAHSEAVLRALKLAGVHLSLDDFGTGYSSLSYLKRFPFDKVKIDQSFVRGIGTIAQDAVIAKVVISMAHGLGLRVIAEGVETEAQCEFMRSNMCDEIQGYFFSHPLAKADIEALLVEGRHLPGHLVRVHTRQRTLLLVDDEINVVSALKRLLRLDGYRILSANSGQQGLEMLADNAVDIIVSDQRMPGMSGVDFLRQAKILYPDTIRIVLSGYTELKSVTDAINEGAVYRFLTKPWEDSQLRTFIREAFEHKELADENAQLNLKVRTANQELAASNRQLQEVLGRQQHEITRGELSLRVVRDALQYVPLPVIGLDDEGVVAFINAQAQTLLSGTGDLLGVELASVLPDLGAVLQVLPQGELASLRIADQPCQLRWHRMGEHSTASGKLLTLLPVAEADPP